MDWDFIIQCVLALGFSFTLLALLDARMKLRDLRKKNSRYYSISKGLEDDTSKQRDVIEEQSGTIREQRQEIESLEAELSESKAMARMLMERNVSDDGAGNYDAGVRPLTQRLLMLSDELANVYYESSSRPETMSQRIKQTLHAVLTGRDALEQINSLIEASYPGFLEDLNSAFPWMTEDDRQLISLMCCGISPNAVSVILGMDLNRLNKWKTRLAKQMNAPVRLSKFLNEKLLDYCNEAPPVS